MRKVASRKNGRCKKGSKHVKGKKGCFVLTKKKATKKRKK